jgi:hypothetical protein
LQQDEVHAIVDAIIIVGSTLSREAHPSAGKLSQEKTQPSPHQPSNAFTRAPLNGGARALGRLFRAESVQQLCESYAAPSFNINFGAIVPVLPLMICVKRAALLVNLSSCLWLRRL